MVVGCPLRAGRAPDARRPRPRRGVHVAAVHVPVVHFPCPSAVVAEQVFFDVYCDFEQAACAAARVVWPRSSRCPRSCNCSGWCSPRASKCRRSCSCSGCCSRRSSKCLRRCSCSGYCSPKASRCLRSCSCSGWCSPRSSKMTAARHELLRGRVVPPLSCSCRCWHPRNCCRISVASCACGAPVDVVRIPVGGAEIDVLHERNDRDIDVAIGVGGVLQLGQQALGRRLQRVHLAGCRPSIRCCRAPAPRAAAIEPHLAVDELPTVMVLHPMTAKKGGGNIGGSR